jgi:tetratricopeptide (TPR) repeat protein
MKTKNSVQNGSGAKPWALRMAVLACALGLGMWALLSILVSGKLPEDFPKLPDLQSQNAVLRELLIKLDARARSHPGSAEDLGNLGMAYHSNLFLEQAEGAYAIASRLAPDDFRWAYCRSLLAEEKGREGEQLELLKTTVRLKSDYQPALLKLADIHFKKDRLVEAARYYELGTGVAGQDSSLQARFGLGRIAARHMDWHKVIEYAAPLSTTYPHVRPPHQLLLDAYEALGQEDKAAEERANLLLPKLVVVPPVKDPLNEQLTALCCASTRLLKEAGLQSRFGHPDQAIQIARRAVEVEPGDADARHFLARTLLDTHGDDAEAVNEALAQLEQGLRLRPDDLLPLWYFTANFFEQDKTDAAVEQLRALLSANANREDAHYYLGLVADHQGRTQEAAAQYQAALRSDPDNAEAWHKLGLILVTQGRLGQAIAHFQKALKLNPTLTVARCNLGVALEQQGKTGQAITQFVEALRLRPSDAPTHLFLAIALMKTGKIEQSASHFRETIRLTPDDAQAHYGLGGALALMNRTEEAAKEVREALRLKPDYPEARDLLQKLESPKP